MRTWSKGIFVLLACISLHCAPTAPVPPPKTTGPATVVEPETPKAAAKNPLQSRLEAAIDAVRSRPLLTTHGFWTIFHGILGLGPDTATLQNPESGEKVKALDYVCKGNKIRGLDYLVTPEGVDVKLANPGTGIEIYVGQGHQDQFIAEMVEWGVSPKRTFIVNGKEHPFQDFLNYSLLRASTTQKQELSWAIIVIGEHYGTNKEWVNGAGEKLRYEDIVRYELNQPIDSAACGGTHRLYGLTWALYRYRERGGKLEGVWKEVVDKLEELKLNAKKNQNKLDGSFSTDYFRGPAAEERMEARISTSGHILEWLAFYLPDSELKADWVQQAANAVSLMVLNSHQEPVEGGALYHAAHGLYLYHDRVYGDPKARRPYPLPLR